MKDFINSFIILLPLILQNVSCVKGKKLGDSCSFDEECSTLQSYCRDRTVCDCRPGFYSDQQQTTCFATIEAVCKNDADCSTLSGSSCKMGLCKCRDDYVAQSGKRKCLQIATSYQQICEDDIQCNSGFGDQGFCNQAQCVCRNNYHFSATSTNQKVKCIRNKGFREQCSDDSECYVDENSRPFIVCRDRKCDCREGYVIQDNFCKAGAASLETSTSISILFIFITLIINKKM